MRRRWAGMIYIYHLYKQFLIFMFNKTQSCLLEDPKCSKFSVFNINFLVGEVLKKKTNRKTSLLLHCLHPLILICLSNRIYMKRWMLSPRVETMAGVFTRAHMFSLLQSHLVEIHPENLQTPFSP